MSNRFDELVGNSLREQRDDQVNVCLDAEMSAAWFSGRLSAAERAAVQTHLSRCGRCQEIIAALARMEEPQRAAAWWRTHAVRWLIPAVTAAAAAIVWINVPSGPALEEPLPPASAQARLEPAPAPPLAEPSAPAPGPRAQPPAASDSASILRDRATPPTSSSANAAGAMDPTVQSAAAGPPSTPAALPQASAPPRVEGAVQGAPQAALPHPGETRVADLIARLAATSPRGPAVGIISSAGGRALWRLSGSRVERSDDDGLTWLQQHTGAAALTAGASPSDDVCWIVGRGGLVLQTRDGGQAWKTIAFPVTDDLIAVSADDAKGAIVTAVGGRTFRTTDGGITWR